MSDLKDRVCWTVSTAVSTLSTEAVSPSTAVFMATHAPLSIRRRDPQLLPGAHGVSVSEEEVLNDFLNRSPGNGALLMPVIGESGTGKSHLVRWVHERTRNQSDRRRVIIHIPKASTSLRALVRILLEREDIQSEKLTQLRNQVDDLASGMDQEALQRHLVFALAEAVAVAEPGTDPSRRALTGSGNLAEVLQDVAVRHHLTKNPESLIPRLAASLLNDRGDGESDRPTKFTPEDLPHIADVNEAAQRVRKLLTMMMGRPQMQTAAAELITENLSTAVQQVFKLGGRLQDAMLTIREEYHRQGKEIVLLIEDFAVIQGLQRDLLDVLIEAGIRDGQQVYAPIRTLMAITSGYYRDLAKTVVTRMEAATPYVYDLDADFNPDHEGRQRTQNFVGRYLNAARIGAGRLEEAGVADSAPVPNACDDCKFRESCHESFGVSPSGHGLFPFNWTALRRAIRSTPGRDEGDTFNPRRIIGRVIRPVLEDGDDLASGRFPNARFREQFPPVTSEPQLHSKVHVALETADPATAERRALLLEFWGDAPAEVTNVDSGIHDAFGIPELTTTPRVMDRTPTASPAKPALTKAAPAPGPVDPKAAWPRALREHLAAVEQWAAGHQPLTQNTAAEVRRIVSAAVYNRCDWSSPLMGEPNADVKKLAWPASRSSVVSIRDAAGEGHSEHAPIRFERDRVTAVFFGQLLTLQAKVDDPGNEKALPQLAKIAERHQPDLVKAVLRIRGGQDDLLVKALRASLIGAAVAGHARPGMKDTELMAAAFDNGAAWQLTDAALRVDTWKTAFTNHRAARLQLITEIRQLLGVPQGMGAVRMLDSARVVRLVRQAADWSWQHVPSAEAKWIHPANAPLARFGELVEHQNIAFREINQRLSGLLPPGVNLKDTLDAIDQAFKMAGEVGLLPGGEEFRLNFVKRLDEARDLGSEAVDQLRNDLGKLDKADDSRWQQLAIVTATRPRGAGLKPLADFLTESGAWLDRSLAAAALRAGGTGDDLARQVREVCTEWERIVVEKPVGEGSDE
ncbi:protein DpdH [Actinoplanes sp. DH11]|uniref:protein DpdH n=1 Tax=Actinoplanes sp. DH11 TaxID=2857011 RepID=UPI001E42AFC7|nr:protein DpdH [Actinoplanes sp. DH11]